MAHGSMNYCTHTVASTYKLALFAFPVSAISLEQAEVFLLLLCESVSDLYICTESIHHVWNDCQFACYEVPKLSVNYRRAI